MSNTGKTCRITKNHLALVQSLNWTHIVLKSSNKINVSIQIRLNRFWLFLNRECFSVLRGRQSHVSCVPFSPQSQVLGRQWEKRQLPYSRAASRRLGQNDSGRNFRKTKKSTCSLLMQSIKNRTHWIFQNQRPTITMKSAKCGQTTKSIPTWPTSCLADSTIDFTCGPDTQIRNISSLCLNSFC